MKRLLRWLRQLFRRAPKALPVSASVATVPFVDPHQRAYNENRLVVTIKGIHDGRLVAEMPFGYEAGDQRATEEAWVRSILIDRIGAVRGDDVRKIGCTTVALKGLTRNEAERLRMGLAGSGIGLTCYVDGSRFCEVHRSVGALQPGQEQRDADGLDAVSRPLTTEERAVEAIKFKARVGVKGSDAAAELLVGRDREHIVEALEDEGLIPPQN